MNSTTKVGIAGAIVAAVVAVVAVSLPPGELGEMDKALRLVDASIPTAVAANATPTVTAVKSGNWSDPSVWSTGALPQTDDKVLIPPGTTVWQDVDTPKLKWVYGAGTFGPRGPPCTLWAETVVTGMSSTLAVGSPSTPFAGRWNIKFADYGALDATADPWAVGRGLITCGQCAIYGAPKDVRAFLSADALAGQSALTLGAAPINWSAGDTLVVPGINPTANEDDEVVIQSISGTTVTLATPLKFNHPISFTCCGTAQRTYMLAANYAPRSVNIFSENAAAGHRGHVMVMRPDLTTPLVWHNLSIQDCGRTDKSFALTDPDGAGNGLANPRGRYPWHAHRCNPLITGVMGDVYGLVVVGSPGWGPTNHDSYFGISSSLAYKIAASHYVSETPTGTGYFADCTAIRSTQPNNDRIVDDDRGIADFGHDGHGFWDQNSFVTFKGANVVFGASNSGFVTIPEFDLPGKPPMLVDPRNLPAQFAASAPTAPYDSRITPKIVQGMHVIGCESGHIFWGQEGNPVDPAPIGRCALSDSVGLVAFNGWKGGYMSQIDHTNVVYSNYGSTFNGSAFCNSGFQGSTSYTGVMADGFEIGIDAPTNDACVISSPTLRCLCGIHITNNTAKPPRSIAITTPTFIPIAAADLAALGNRRTNPNADMLLYVQGGQQQNVHMRFDAFAGGWYGMDQGRIANFFQSDTQIVYPDLITLDGKYLYFPETGPSFPLDNVVNTIYQYIGAGGGGTLPDFCVHLTVDQLLQQFGIAVGELVLPSDAQPLANSIALISASPPTALPHIQVTSQTAFPVVAYQETNSPTNYPLWVKDASGNFFFAGNFNLKDKYWNACSFTYQGRLRSVVVHCDSTLTTFRNPWPGGVPSSPPPPAPPPPSPPPPTMVTVPDLVTALNAAQGSAYSNATNTAAAARLTVTLPDHVFTQTPVAGTSVPAGTPITVQ